MLDAVKRKGGKYGDLNLPFIVAVGHAAAFPEDEDTETALYGTSVEYTHARTPTLGRKADGYWTATYAHAHGRVSGVLIVDNPAPWTWAKNIPSSGEAPTPDHFQPPSSLPGQPHSWSTSKSNTSQRLAPPTPPSVCPTTGRSATPSHDVN